MKKDLVEHSAAEEGMSFLDIEDRKGAILAALGRRGWDVDKMGAELNIGGNPKTKINPKGRRIVTVGFSTDSKYVVLNLGWHTVHDERIAYAPNLWFLATFMDKVARSIPVGHGNHIKVGDFIPLPKPLIQAIRDEISAAHDSRSQIVKTKPQNAAADMGM